MMSQATTGTSRLIPVMAALPRMEMAKPRRRMNHRLTTALATTGPTADSPSEASQPYTSASCKRWVQSPVRAREMASSTEPAEVMMRGPKRSTSEPIHGMKSPYRSSPRAMTREKAARSTPRSAVMGLRKGPTAWRTPADTKTLTEKGGGTHQPKKTRDEDMNVPTIIAGLVWAGGASLSRAATAPSQRGEPASVDPERLSRPELPLPASRRSPHLLGLRDGDPDPRLVRHGAHGLRTPPHSLRLPAVRGHADLAAVRCAGCPTGRALHAVRDARNLRGLRRALHDPRLHRRPHHGTRLRARGPGWHRALQRSRHAQLAHRRDHSRAARGRRS